MAGLYIVLGGVQRTGPGQLGEHAGVHHGGHQVVGGRLRADAQGRQGGVRVHLPDAAVRVLAVDLRGHIVGILNGGGVVDNGAVRAFQKLLQGLHIVGGNAGNHLGNELPHRHHALLGVSSGLAVGGHQGGDVHAAAEDLQRVFRQGGTLHVQDVVVDAGGQGDDQGNADDADGPGKGGEQGTGLFGPQVVETQGQGGQQGHGGAAHVLVHRGRLLGGVRLVGLGVGADDAVLQGDDTGGVLLGQLRVVGDHDHQTVPGHLLEQLHHLNTGLAVQCTGGLVRQQDIRVVHQCAGNGHTLHLAAGHLAGVLVELVAQAHLFQGFDGPAFALGPGDAGDGQGQFHVGQHRLMGNQVVALEHKAYGVVAVGVPVPVGVLLGGDAVDDQVAAVVAVQTADDVQQRGLAGAAGAKNRHKLVVPQVQTDIIQRVLYQLAGFVFLVDLFEFEHR